MGTETRKYRGTEKRTIINYNRILSQTGEQTLLCVDKGALSIARKLVRDRGLWRSTYATNYNNSTYNIPDAQEFDIIDSIVGQFLEDTKPMNCNDLIVKLEDIASSIRETACCSGTGSAGAGSSDIPATTETDDGSTFYPAGYADRSEYLDNKCQLTEHIRQAVVADLQYILEIDVVAIGIGVFGAALLSPIPGDELVLFLGLLIANSLAGLLATQINGLITQLNDNAQDIRCGVYDATTADGVIAAFKSPLTLSGTQDVILDYFLNYTTVNQFFEYVGPLNYGVVCDTCDCAVVAVAIGTLDEIGSDYAIISPASVGPTIERATWLFNYQGGAYCGPGMDNVNVSVDANYSSGSSEASADIYIRYKDQSSYSVDEKPVGPWTEGLFDNVEYGWVTGVKPASWRVTLTW